MRPTRFGLAAALAITLLAAAAAPAFAGDGGRDDDEREDREGDRGRDHDEDDDRDEKRLEWRKHGGDKWLLRNDEISVWFHQGENGKAKPSLKVFHTDADGNVSGYSVEVKRVLEIGPEREDDDHEDEDDDKDDSILEGTRKHNEMKLSKKDDWNVDIDETNTTMTITMVRAEAQGIVTLVFHVSKTSPAVKFDFKVDNWRWDDNASGHRLALVMVTHEREIREDGERNATVAGGYISWAPTATVKYGNVSRVANVTADSGNEEDGGRLALVFEAPGGYDALDYDPTFGVASASAAERPLPAASFAIAAMAVGAVALVMTRRPE